MRRAGTCARDRPNRKKKLSRVPEGLLTRAFEGTTPAHWLEGAEVGQKPVWGLHENYGGPVAMFTRDADSFARMACCAT